MLTMNAKTTFSQLVILVLTSLYVVHGEKSRNFFIRSKEKYMQTSFRQTESKSQIGCCTECENTDMCNSASYDTTTGTCLLAKEPLVGIHVYGQTNSTWLTYSKDEWMLVFRGTPGAGGDLYAAWINGSSVTTDDVTCMTTNISTCSQHYRHPIVNSWSSIGMSKVKVVYYKDGVVGAFIIFNATGSDILNWFSPSRILDTSWLSVTLDPFLFFSIEGDAGRRWFIVLSYPGCSFDPIYTVTLTGTGIQTCEYDKQTSFPQFLYSTTTSYGYPETMIDMEKADVMAIYIK